MRAFVRRIRDDERGLTLVELIASLSIMSMVMGTIYGVITFGFNAYHKVTIENDLRNESDLIMSAIINEMYEFGADRVKKHKNRTDGQLDGITLIDTLSDGNDEEKYILLKTDGEGLRLYIGGDEEGLAGDESHMVLRSQLLPGSTIELKCPGSPEPEACGSGLIDVRMELGQTYEGKEHKLALQSKFGF
ncbi:hypothetical protein PM3016_6790 [Paenibacillus mucilaginosus 3016]|uniref:Prepilin-type N-terminal cleavage/methylation domain-containing protein n=2 Tax=Paenibacillus mucilaginosus TaxID=61624 RepID=H6NPN8_9BACL|nr:prepilin-type N-terminal cleavage/methylation domain-containing protein [Paenibacillus mucilaginosus]AFC33394.1 hypothetical protein PM3016_6790 [Paenibacillus mucilaginosus 3016]AFH65705.1 hypothetical protein B2K_34240 [Paenibacillus mucilaginosus K02]WFA21805.1 prepilin-type N-terminal cleavage/methylation domain-containing protein [Paenibacillus mucilaginosus]